MSVEHDGAADDGPVTVKSAAPELVSKDDRLGCVPAALEIIEEAPEQRLDAEHGKEVLRHGHAGEAFRLASPRETDVTRSIEWKHTGNACPRTALRSEREQ